VTTSTHADTCTARPLGPLGGTCTCTTTTSTRPSSDVEHQDQDVATIGVVAAADHDQIRDMTTQLGTDHRRVVAIPAPTVDTAAHGRVLDAPLVDHTATHDVDLSDVAPALTASARPVSVVDPPRGDDPIGGSEAPPKAKALLPPGFPTKKSAGKGLAVPRRADVPCVVCGRLVPTYRDSAPADRRRCGVCVKAAADRWEHGTRRGYRQKRCRCDKCRAWAANGARKYRAEYRKRTGSGLRSKYRRAAQDAIAATSSEPSD
jgi:hypothetical protein